VDACLEFSDLSMEYQLQSGTKLRALSDIDIQIKRGEFVTLLGPSGCGKSTLLKIASVVQRPTSGEVRLNGQPLVEPTPDIGMVFQKPILLPWRNVLDNVLLPIEMMGRPLSKSRDAAMELLTLVGLKGFEQSMPNELSGGMQQRVAICRALIYDPAILLMDEPFAALDAMTREELGMELLRIWSEYMKSVLFVTHSIQEGVLLADRVIVMSARPGRVAANISIDLPRPRTFDMVSTPEYGQYAAQIRRLITGKESGQRVYD
jgi:NitT/TauT family transport system ATP-binding protein